MKAIISTTYSDTYLYFLPICVWLWNRLGVDVICFEPDLLLSHSGNSDIAKAILIKNTLNSFENKNNKRYSFICPKHKEATYAQCSRLYGACLDLPEDELLVTSDIDMGVFSLPPFDEEDDTEFTIFGCDLVPKGQVPMCYIVGKVKDWRNRFELNGKTYQQCLDETIGKEECENMRGNLWSRDQETAYNKLMPYAGIYLEPRSNGQNQVAQRRYDRDDAYILGRLSPDTIDYHMNRPGYEDKNFQTILTILEFHYPLEDFTWLENYNQQYKKLL